VLCLASSSTLRREAKCSSESLIKFYRTTRRYIPEDRNKYIDTFEKLKTKFGLDLGFTRTLIIDLIRHLKNLRK
jgi:hypothetical protein